jgi:hypothetical protein
MGVEQRSEGGRVWLVLKLFRWRDLKIVAENGEELFAAPDSECPWLGQGFVAVFTDRETALREADSPDQVLEAEVPRGYSEWLQGIVPQIGGAERGN